MSKEKNTAAVLIPPKVWFAILAVLSVGTASGGVSLVRSLTPADVSKQIRDESPAAVGVSAHSVSDQIETECLYLEDRALIMYQLAEQSDNDSMLFEKVDDVEKAVNKAHGEQRLMNQALIRIEKALNK